MESNLLWMAGRLAPPVNYTLSAGAAPKQWRPPDERESEHEGEMTLHGAVTKIVLSHPTSSGTTLYSAHRVHFHHCMKSTNAIITVNMVAGMHDLSLLAAQPTQFCVCVCGGGVQPAYNLFKLYFLSAWMLGDYHHYDDYHSLGSCCVSSFSHQQSASCMSGPSAAHALWLLFSPILKLMQVCVDFVVCLLFRSGLLPPGTRRCGIFTWGR